MDILFDVDGTIADVHHLWAERISATYERQLRRIPNVEGATASASRARVEVVTRGPVSGVDLAEAIEAAGYAVGRTPWLTPDRDTWLAAASGLVLIVSVAILAELLGFTGLTAGLGDIRLVGLLYEGTWRFYLTNIFDAAFTPQIIYDLYRQRWSIEILAWFNRG